MLEKAARQFRRRSEGAPYAAGAVSLDSDRRDADHDRDRRAINIAARLKLLLVWQETCHEAFLLRHLPDCEHLRPPSTQIAKDALHRHWPAYESPMPALRRALRLDRSAVLRGEAGGDALRQFRSTNGCAT